MRWGRWGSRVFIVMALAALLGTPVRSQQTTDPISFARAQRLKHGVNASMWFAQSRDYSQQKLETYVTPQDILLIAEMGFDHIRLSIEAAPLMDWQRTHDANNVFMMELDRAVKTIVDDHLSVVIDLHPESTYKATLHDGTAGVQRFTELWRALASHFANTDAEHVFFEILNEPEQEDPYRWQGIESTVADAIRTVAPNHTIIATGAHYSGLDDLLMLEPIAVSNVIYTFHDYEPFSFTHQGATWASPEVEPLRGIPYPSTPENVTPELTEEPNLLWQYRLEQYGLARWDATRVERTIEFAARWSLLHKVPLYCGEFGVFRSFAPPEMRAEWLHDMRVALDKNGIGWAVWDYQANFGVVTKNNGVTTPDTLVLNALGLHAPR